MLRTTAPRFCRDGKKIWYDGLSPLARDILKAKFASDPTSESVIKAALAMPWQGRRLRRILKQHTDDQTDYTRLVSIMNAAREASAYDTMIRLEQDNDSRIAMRLNADQARVTGLMGDWQGYTQRWRARQMERAKK